MANTDKQIGIKWVMDCINGILVCQIPEDPFDDSTAFVDLPLPLVDLPDIIITEAVLHGFKAKYGDLIARNKDNKLTTSGKMQVIIDKFSEHFETSAWNRSKNPESIKEASEKAKKNAEKAQKLDDLVGKLGNITDPNVVSALKDLNLS